MSASLGPDAPVLVLDALALLPPLERQVLVLHDLAGLSVLELADRLDRPPTTVATQLVHGRAVLASHLRRSA